jgi:hypothetical protein
MSSTIEIAARTLLQHINEKKKVSKTELTIFSNKIKECDSDPDGSKAMYRVLAKEILEKDGELEIDEDAIVSLSEDGGAYVQAWVYLQGDLFTPVRYNRGMPVLSKDGKIKGKLTGGSRHCGLHSCTGRTLGVRWDDGKLTYPCTKGMNFNNGIWKIG